MGKGQHKKTPSMTSPCYLQSGDSTAVEVTSSTKSEPPERSIGTHFSPEQSKLEKASITAAGSLEEFRVSLLATFLTCK